MRVHLLIILLAVAFIAACVQEEKPAQPETPTAKTSVKIGVLVPETGTFSTAGVAMKNAAMLAAKHIKELGLAKNYEVELVFADCGSTPEQAKSAFMQLAAQNVIAIVGAYSSPQAVACADAAKETGVVYIASVASTKQLEQKVQGGNKFVFRVSYNSTYWGVLAAEFISLAKPDHYCFVGFDPLKTFNQEMLKAIEEKSAAEKICEVYYKSPAVSPDDVKVVAAEVAKKMGSRDVVILGDPGKLSITFLKEYRGNGGKGIVYSVGGALALPSTLEKLKANYTAFQAAALEETRKTDLTEKYFSDYRKAYGEEANNYAALLTYDALLILAQALEKGGDLIETLENGEFKGAAGVYEFDARHTAKWGSKELKGVIGEYVDGIKVLYPPEFATSEVIWGS